MTQEYNRGEPVDFNTWQTELAFERTAGGERETIARTKDAQQHYDNYRIEWYKADDNVRYAIDQQHGFYGGELVDNTPVAAVAASGGGGGEAAPVTPVIPVEEDQPDSTREVISPTPGNPETESPGGLEDTVNTTDSEAGSTVFDQGAVDTEAYDDEFENAEVINNVTPAAPSEQVKDPATGQVFDNPAAARAAGITNWVYVVDQQPASATAVTVAQDPTNLPGDGTNLTNIIVPT